MHQRQLLALGSRIGIVPTEIQPPEPHYTAPDYPAVCMFLHPKPGTDVLTVKQKKLLHQHYETILDIEKHAALANMDPNIRMYRQCYVDDVLFHSEVRQNSNAARLNNLACTHQAVDLNARFKEGTRPEKMVLEYFYVYIHFFALHCFDGDQYMLVYSSFRKVDVHDGLVEDKGHWHSGFQDIRVLDHLCARVKAAGGKTYFVDEQTVMQQRLQTSLASVRY
jgi:hypothetical protein